MAGMVDNVNKFWLQTVSKPEGLDIQGYKSKEHLAKEMIRQLITDWSDESFIDENKVEELKLHIDGVVEKLKKDAEEEKLRLKEENNTFCPSCSAEFDMDHGFESDNGELVCCEDCTENYPEP